MPFIDILIFSVILILIVRLLRSSLRKNSNSHFENERKSSKQNKSDSAKADADYQSGPWGSSGDRNNNQREQRKRREDSSSNGSETRGNQRKTSDKQSWSGSAGDNTFASDLKLFGLDQTYTLQQLKVARNKKLKENHPDRVTNLSKEIQQVAKEQSQRLNEAYERLRQAL